MSKYTYLDRPIPNHIVEQIRADAIEEIFDKAHDADADSNYIYLRFEIANYDIGHLMYKSDLKERFKEQLKEQKKCH